jgi:hypothetical protein
MASDTQRMHGHDFLILAAEVVATVFVNTRRNVHVSILNFLANV